MDSHIVKCPNCGKYRKTSSLKAVKCFSCGKSVDVKKHMVSESSYLRAVNKSEVDFE